MKSFSLVHRICIVVGFAICLSGTSLNAQTVSKEVLGQKSSRDAAKTAGQSSSGQSRINQTKLGKSKTRNGNTTVSNARRSELMNFVKSNHPEIRPLLKMLQKSRPAKYQSTIRTLDREVRSLQTLKTKHPERYESALEFWTVKSRISLLSAQLATKKSKAEQAKIKDNLNELITKRNKIRKTEIEQSIARTTAQLERMNTQLGRLQTQLEQVSGAPEEVVKRELEKIETSANRIRQSRQKSKEATRKKKNDQKSKDQKKKSSPSKSPASNDAQ
ncbi:MAG: hypothetical protein AB8B55_16765 [Mariniblastus sp.]